MSRIPTRVLLLLMGLGAAAIWTLGYVRGQKPDDSLLVFAGSMFTTYALTERSFKSDDPPEIPEMPEVPRVDPPQHLGKHGP